MSSNSRNPNWTRLQTMAFGWLLTTMGSLWLIESLVLKPTKVYVL